MQHIENHCHPSNDPLTAWTAGSKACYEPKPRSLSMVPSPLSARAPPRSCVPAAHTGPRGSMPSPGSQQRTLHPQPRPRARGPPQPSSSRQCLNLQMHSSHLGNSKTHIPLLSLFLPQNDPKRTPGTRFVDQATTGSSKHVAETLCSCSSKQQWTPTQETLHGKHDRAPEAPGGTRHTRVPSQETRLSLSTTKDYGKPTQSFQ